MPAVGAGQGPAHAGNRTEGHPAGGSAPERAMPENGPGQGHAPGAWAWAWAAPQGSPNHPCAPA